jgi:hypothetical protein
MASMVEVGAGEWSVFWTGQGMEVVVVATALGRFDTAEVVTGVWQISSAVPPWVGTEVAEV